ncbi:hypothetical protein SKAU_G00268480 [Synaphobranchus kaupii]|uniref:Uncharacterized protein n=1 Tax=Synaphobranchus kaupii TaxID=118154 RepID=A0A9Q1F042_SYNKA|nr:hypothetical protein SKAU_G00268480 [Synaphobranchus kaupii]
MLLRDRVQLDLSAGCMCQEFQHQICFQGTAKMAVHMVHQQACQDGLFSLHTSDSSVLRWSQCAPECPSKTTAAPLS